MVALIGGVGYRFLFFSSSRFVCIYLGMGACVGGGESLELNVGGGVDIRFFFTRRDAF